MERKLASIRRVSDIIPIEGADRIVLAQIDGWQLITQKTNYVSGDLCVYFEIDSFLPVEERYEFLRKGCFKSTKNLGDGFRIKTMKMKGHISQGLSLPLSEFPECQNLPEDTDVTELLKIQKYEKPISANLAGIAKGNFPSYIRKTDQERAQNLTKYFDRYRENNFEVTLKLDGSSITVYKNFAGELGVCSRNIDLKDSDDNLFWKVAKESNILQLVSDFDCPIAIQGELMGPGVQGNREKFSEHRLYVFDIWDIETQNYWRPEERQKLLARSPTLYHAPIIYKDVKLGNLLNSGNNINDLLLVADGPSVNNAIREGVVFKSNDASFSFKIINNKFLLKEED